MSRSWTLGLLLLSAAVVTTACGGPEEFVPYAEERAVVPTLELGNTTITVETATNLQERRQGLMDRPSMPADHGMLFLYPEPKHLWFWMKNTYIPLDIAFMTFDPATAVATIVNIEDMEPHEESPGAISHEKVTMALEMNKGWFAGHGIRPGMTIEMPDWVLDLAVE